MFVFKLFIQPNYFDRSPVGVRSDFDKDNKASKSHLQQQTAHYVSLKCRFCQLERKGVTIFSGLLILSDLPRLCVSRLLALLESVGCSVRPDRMRIQVKDA